MTIKYLTLAAAVAVLSAPAFAQGNFTPPTPAEQEASFAAADANKDGKLDKVELKNTLPEQFRSQIDDERLGQMFTRRDADKDGFVSKAEFMAPRQRPQ